MSNDFSTRLKEGMVGESLIAKWLMRRGFSVLPAYEKMSGGFKGPRIYSARGDLIAPDMLIFRFDDEADVMWIEAKSKAAFTWYRIGETYQDGIDGRCWTDYQELQTRCPWPVWLLFLHAPGRVAKDNPPGMTPPAGLFGGDIPRLAKCVDHISDRYGNGGMVYWTVSDLSRQNGKPIATWEEVVPAEMFVDKDDAA